MTPNLLCLNPSKTEFIRIDLREQLKKIPYQYIFKSTGICYRRLDRDKELVVRFLYMQNITVVAI